jgi:ABC-type transporter Mla MlaB component
MAEATLQIEDGAAQLSGDLTFLTVKGLYDRMRDLAASNGMPCSVNLADVVRIDSAGLALLLEWQSQFRKDNGADTLMQIGSPPAALLKIARLCGAEEYLSQDITSREE